MKLFSNSTQAESRKIPRDFPSSESPSGRTAIWKHPFIDESLPGHPGQQRALPTPGETCLYPIGYLVRQEPHSVIQTHFHRVDQFQVFVGGTGQFAKRGVAPYLVHYANAWSAYGPIRSGERGIDYFTLRRHWDTGAGWMPGTRDALLAQKQRQPRNLVFEPFAESAASHALHSEPDGLGAWYQRLLPGECPDVASPASGGGQYWLVLAGSLEGMPHSTGTTGSRASSDAQPGQHALMFLSPDEPDQDWVAGRKGAQLLVMQFPRRA